MIKTVIVTDCMYRSAIAAIHSLNKLGEEIIAVSVDTRPDPPSFHSRFLKGRVVLSSDKAEYCTQLIELCEKYERPVIFPTGVFTLNVISENKDKFEAVADFAVADKNVLELLNDKKRSKEIAEEAGLLVPERTQSFPMVVKPYCGEKFGLKASQRYRIVKNSEELKQAISYFSEYDTSPIVEEYINGQGAGVSVVIGKDGIERSAFCHKRLSEYPASGGPSSSLIAFRDEQLMHGSVELLKSAGFTGIAMVEFKSSEKGYYFLEVNPRIWGSFGATDKTDSDFMKAYLSASRGTEYKFDPKYKIKKVKFLPNIFASVVSYLKAGKIKLALSSLADAVNPFVPNAVFSINDPLPAILDIFRKRR